MNKKLSILRRLISKQIFSSTIIAFLIAIFLPCESYASEAFLSEMCNLYNIVTGNGGKAFAAFAIISVGIGFFTGKVSWGLMVGVSIGIATLFGAPSIVSAVSGQPTFVCEKATYHGDCADGAICDSCPTGRTGLTCQDYLPGYSSESESGCDEAAGYTKVGETCYKSCDLSSRGINSRTATHASNQTIACNATNFAGNLTYTCENGELKNIVNNCICAGNFTGDNCDGCIEGYTLESGCNECALNYTGTGGICQKDCFTPSTNTIPGIPAGRRLIPVAGTTACGSPYTNAVDYSCVGGELIFSSICNECQETHKMISGTCQPNCIINTVGKTTVAGVGATSLDATASNETGTKACDASYKYSGTLSYTCTSQQLQIISPCNKTITTIFLTNTGSLSTWTVPSDWDSSSNSIEVIGGGGGGGAYSDIGGGGGGGGAYSKKTNLALVAGSSVNYKVGSGGNGGVQQSATSAGVGGDTWFGGATFLASSVGAKGGSAGMNSGSASGGSHLNGIGATKYSGGAGGSAGYYAGAGGGGSGGQYGNGANGVNYSNADGGGGGGGGSNGGIGNTNSGSGGLGANSSGIVSGTGGASVTGSGASGMPGSASSNSCGGGGSGGNFGSPPGSGGSGGAGKDWDSTHGSGGGGGGAGDQPGVMASSAVGGAGGLYGAGGGGAGADLSVRGGAGAQGIIVIKY